MTLLMTLLRGSTHGARCAECPFAVNGAAQHPVTSEYPEDPRWILVGESPGRTEVQLNRPFQGSQQLIEKMLLKIGRRRDELVLTTAALCTPPMAATEHDRENAAKACRPRLQQELAQWPGMPVLTLGAIAARALIPKAVLDAIDPPNVPKSKKRGQKERQKAEAKALLRATKADAKAVKHREDTIAKLTKTRLKALEEHQRQLLIAEAVRPARGTTRPRKKPTRAWTDHEMERYLPQLAKKAAVDAITQYQLVLAELAMQIKHEEANPKPVKPPKHKGAKITDIMSTCFDVDVDGTGVLRPLIPTIHPGSLLRGGGATIGGTHTPDLAFINLYYDASKVDALSQGKDIRLKVDVETEIADPERCGQLVRDAIDRAFVEGELSIDLETYVDDIDRHHALMAYMARIRTIGLATNGRSISVMWAQIPSWALSYLQLVLAHPNVTKTFHNGIYDRTVLAANGFAVEGPWEDTLLGHHASFPGCAHRLQAVTSQFFAVSPWKSEFRNAEETPEGLTKYNALDTGATHALRPAMTLWIKRTKTEKIYALDKKMAEIASKMHLAGMPVSRDENSELLRTFTHNVVESRRAVEEVAENPKLRDEIYHFLALQQAQKARLKDPTEWIKSDGEVVTGIEARYEHRMAQLRDEPGWKWKVSANKHIAALLRALGVSLPQQTASGQISTKKDVLEGLVNVPVVRDILTFRENDKLLSTFVWQIFDRFDNGGSRIQCGYADDDDRIHPIWTVHKITGRWASAEPVVSNVPKDKFKRLADGTKQILRPNLRKQIRAPEGRIFVGFDFCLAKGTLIDTPNGHRPIEDLTPGDLVFSYNQETHRPACSKVVNKVSTGVRPTLVVVLDNGERVRCTPDHRWLVRVKGEEIREVQAQHLAPGTRLLPLRRSKAGTGSDYETLYAYSAFKYTKTHVAVAEGALGPRPSGSHVHHVDADRFNNRPDNLAYVDSSEHLSEHATVATTAQWKNPAVRDKMRAGISEAIAERGGHHGKNNPNYGKRTGLDGTCPQCDTPTYFGGKHPKKFCSRDCYHAFRRANPTPRGTALGDLNHKVVEVVDDGLCVETFDIEVERDHNFALAAGVFVHNCQLEARIIALISGDPFLCQVFADGLDIHRECARVIFAGFDKMPKDDQKQAREQTKPLEYGAFYGGSIETLWKQMLKNGSNAKLVDIAAAVGLLMKRMAGVVAWQRNTVAQASQPPYEVRDFLLGRRRTFPLGQVEATEAMNFGVQAAGAAIMNTGMARMDDVIGMFKQAFAIAQIHDAAVFECWEDDAPRLAEEVTRCFTQAYERDGRMVPFPVDVKIGKSWADV